MADDATIIEAVETLQRALETFAPSLYEGGVTGEVTPEFYDALSQFLQNFQEIEGVAIAINQADGDISGIYDSIIGESLTEFLNSEDFTAFRENLNNGNILEAVRSLNEWDAPEIFIRNPQLLLNFATASNIGVADFVAALNTLEEAGELNSRPHEFTAEQLELQPEAIVAIETQLQEDMAFFIGVMDAEKTRAETELAALPDDASEEETLALNNRIEAISSGLERLQENFTAIENLTPGGEFEPEFQEALTAYTAFLQQRNSWSYYIRDGFEGGVPTAEDYVDTSGSYTEEYEQYLIQRRASSQELFEELDGNDERTAEQEYQYQSLLRIQNFTDNMAVLVESGIYVQQEPTDTPDELEVIPLDQARSIVEDAIEHMVRYDKVEVQPVLGDEDNGEFDLASRIALQAFLIDLKNTLDIDVEPGSGLYSRAFRDALEERLNTEDAARRRVANTYFKGDDAAVAQLMVALNTYMTDEAVADLPGPFTANIGQTELISMPQFRGDEAQILESAIDRIPDNEMAAMNEMMITLTGFGMEDFMPEGSLSAEQIEAMEHADQSRSDVLGQFFVDIEAEARAALERDGRPISDLEGEMQERMMERLNNLVEDNAAFDVVRSEYMRHYIQDAVAAGLEAADVPEPPRERQLAVGAAVFAETIPTAEEFLQEHGSNRRSYFIYDNDDMVGVTPEVLNGFGGQIDQSDTVLATALSGQTLSSLIDDMAEDFENLANSAIGQRTMAEVHANLAETEALLGRVYNDPANADNMNADGVMVVTDRNGETVLLSQGENGLEVRYLDAAGISAINDFDPEIVDLGEELDLDQVLIQTAMAGYQSMNQGVEYKDNHSPEFFEMGGNHYIVGIDKDTNSIQVVRMDADVISASNAARLSYATTEARFAEVQADLMADPAYNFITEQYGENIRAYGSRDPLFDMMARHYAGMGSADADMALRIMSEARDIDWENLARLEDVPAATDEMILGRAQMIARNRPEEIRDEPFIYLSEGENPRILVVTPALTQETTTDDNGVETTTSVYDPNQPPLVQNITDPALYQAMREEFLTMEIVNQAALDTPAFSGVHDWMLAGGRPPLVQVAPIVTHEPASEEGLASLFDSAAGFESEGRDIEFGTAITETATLVEVLGYDPNLVFAQNRLIDPENSYVVHGVEPVIWQGSEDYHEFLRDHVLVTLQRDGEVITVALEKEDIADNPMRIPLLIQMEHQQELRPTPSIYAADRDRITTEGGEMYVPLQDFSRLAQGSYPVIQDGFWDDQSYWERTHEWRMDVNAFRDGIEAEEQAAREQPSRPLHKALGENITDITAPPAHLDVSGGGVAPDATLSTRPVN